MGLCTTRGQGVFAAAAVTFLQRRYHFAESSSAPPCPTALRVPQELRDAYDHGLAALATCPCMAWQFHPESIRFVDFTGTRCCQNFSEPTLKGARMSDGSETSIECGCQCR